eukprot:TRINITY_DN50575_c0_g1_i1.p1 TRINITY_DN50575_c0_g1~~TRINITY_DN50575_c0_g1_i1.p1  ORF type:complete len:387 (+),score=76.07 TRINITY_DN50575_c0_g1_i1:116-1162(+)
MSSAALRAPSIISAHAAFAALPDVKGGDVALHCAKGFGAAMDWPSAYESIVLGQHPSAYSFLIPVAIAGTAVTSVVVLSHLASLLAAQFHRKHLGILPLFVLTSGLPFLIAVVKLISVVSPRSWKLMVVLAQLFEASAFWGFLKLMLTFAEASASRAGSDLEAVMASLPASSIWCRCSRPRAPKARDVCMIKLLVWQFIGVSIAISLLHLEERFEEQHKVLFSVLDLASLILCFYGEIVLLRILDSLLEGRRSHLKLVALKLLFIATTLSSRICSLIFKHNVEIQGLCYPEGAIAAAWSGALTAILCSVVAVLNCFAYPAADLPATDIYQEGEDAGVTEEKTPEANAV